MVKLIILFRKSPNPDFDERYHDNLALMEQLPGLRRRMASIVHGTPQGEPPFQRILELYFDDRDAMQAALRSPEGLAAGRDLIDFTDNQAVILFADVYEE